MGNFVYPLEEIRAKSDLVEIVSAHVALKKTGSTMSGLCPFHNEKTPSFHVHPERQVWKCYGCGEGGDVFSFVQKMEKLTFPETVGRLAGRAGVRIERSERATRELGEKDRLLFANNAACTFFQTALADSRKAQDYLAKRGIESRTIEKYRLGYAPDSWDSLRIYLAGKAVTEPDAAKAGLLIARDGGNGYYDRFRDRLMVPIVDSSDRVIGFGGRALGDDPAKYLNSPETPLFVKNRTLYGMNFARRAVVEQDQAIVVEGYFDAITAQEAGFENTVATMGTALTEEHVNIMSRFTKNVVLAFDSDSAGMKAALRSWPIFDRAGFDVRVLSMPPGEDPDSLLRTGDKSAFVGLVQGAQPIPDYRIGLVMSEADLNTDAGRSSALRSAAVVIAEVESPLERERLVRVLSKYHPNFTTGTVLAEDHIRAEVARERYRIKGTKQPGNAPQPAETGPAPQRQTFVERAEKQLLGILIVHGGDASKVLETLPPNQFMGQAARSLAEALSKHLAELGKMDLERLRSEVIGTPGEETLTDILLEADAPELNQPVEDLLNSILSRRNFERSLRYRELAHKIQEGSIAQGSEEFEEYWRLAKERQGGFGRGR